MTSRLLLSCGEASGDLYAGALVRELRALAPGLIVEGLGGPHFADAGGRLIADYRGLSVTGLTEPLTKIPRLFGVLRQLVAAARDTRPAALVVIDYPDFNFRLARRVRRLGIPVIYYIGPQFWAWRPGRLATIREIANRVLVIFPFEEELYRKGGVPVTFVGHPLVDLAVAPPSRAAWLADVQLDAAKPVIALLPGSRPNEIRRLLPDLLRTIRIIAAAVPDAQFLVARAPNLDDSLFAACAGTDGRPVRVIGGQTDAVLAAADVALVASGTATVQAALHGTPMVVVYRLSPATYHLGRRLVRIDTFAMVNLIAGTRLVPELIQDAFTPERAAAEAITMLTDGERLATIKAGLACVRARLGAPGASERAAREILAASGLEAGR